MKNYKLLNAVLAFTTCLFAVSSHAALINRGGGLIYDDDLDITWLADSRYALTDLTDARVADIIGTVGSVDGHALTTADFPKEMWPGGDYLGNMTWWGAVAWASTLSYGGAENWRLPVTLVPDSSCDDGFGNPVPTSTGYNCSGSELGHLVHIEWGDPLIKLPGGTEDPVVADFSNLLPDHYWSGTQHGTLTDYAYMLSLLDGTQGVLTKDDATWVWAVHDGDIGAVPVPAGIWLFISGLLGVIGLSRRKRAA